MRRTDCRQEKGSQLMGKNIKPIIPDFKSLIGFLSSREICELNSLGIEITRTKGGFIMSPSLLGVIRSRQ